MTTNRDRIGSAGDEIYAALLAAHEGLSEDQSAALDARLILLLMNEVGDPARLQDLFRAARAAL